ncbi:hypothetical protein JCM10207_008849 [Rhodosporidiobolus poonsookiae]
MCGRFALGLQADELLGAINHDYFAPEPQDHEHAPPADEDEDEAFGDVQRAQQMLGGAGGTAQGAERAHEGEGQQVGDEGVVRWGEFESQARYGPRYNVCPKSRSVVLRKDKKTGKHKIDMLMWGLIPHFFKQPPDAGLSTINAQCESVFEGKNSWRGPRENRRAVIFGQGFYEWLNKGKEKVPHFVKRADGKLMAFAGLWDHCEFGGAFEPVTSFTILTVPVNKQLRFLHSRMPAILENHAEVEAWLANDGWNDKAKALIRPYEGKLECYAVDKGVGKVGNESKSYIQPVASKKGSLDTLFAKQAKSQASSPSKPSASSASPPAATKASASPSPSESTEAEKDSKPDAAAMNPDEDSPAKVEKVEADVERASKAGKTDGRGKKRKKADVEVIDLASSDDEEDDEVKVETPAKKAKKKHIATEGAAKGTERLTDFFSKKD